MPMVTRRKFIQQLAGASALVALGQFPFSNLAAEVRANPKGFTKISILHTNDVHSRIEPFPDGRHKGLGGVARRADIIRKIRKAEEHVLLLDAGDIFQGTPYFNFFEGELDYKIMDKLKYDVATIGNHDFDAGMDVLKKRLKGANFPMVNTNYNFDGTVLDGVTKPYHIIQKGAIKVGVFGVGVELDGLVPPDLFGKTRYKDPIAAAAKTAHQLKRKEKCNFVICLSHLGYEYESDKVSDKILAQKTANIDLILGGHTHTFLEAPVAYTNAEGKEVWVNQVGWAGIWLGRLDIYFQKLSKKKFLQGGFMEVK